jgi:hypothetical protein
MEQRDREGKLAYCYEFKFLLVSKYRHNIDLLASLSQMLTESLESDTHFKNLDDLGKV